MPTLKEAKLLETPRETNNWLVITLSDTWRGSVPIPIEANAKTIADNLEALAVMIRGHLSEASKKV